MFEAPFTARVRAAGPQAAIIAVQGDLTLRAENVLLDAFDEASRAPVETIVFDFAGLNYMNSAGIGLLVSLLVRARRGGQRLAACNLNPHYVGIFAITQIDRAIPVYSSPAAAAHSATRTADC